MTLEEQEKIEEVYENEPKFLFDFEFLSEDAKYLLYDYVRNNYSYYNVVRDEDGSFKSITHKYNFDEV